MTSFLILALVAGLAPAVDQCVQCTDAALCQAHLSAQSAAAKALKPKLRGGAPADRVEALQGLARLSGEHSSVPSAEIAEMVASALGDESLPVRAEAAKLLAIDLHPEVAVRSLVKALDEVRGEIGKLGFGGGGGRFGPPTDEDEKDPKVAERRKLREETMSFARAVVDGLGKLPDDRCVESLADLLRQLTRRTGGELIEPVAQGLLNLESRPAIEALVQKIKAAGTGGGDAGGRWGPDTTGKTLHDLLTKAVAARGLSETPAWSTKDPPDWDKWFARNQKQFPAKLGKYDLAKMRKLRA